MLFLNKRHFSVLDRQMIQNAVASAYGLMLDNNYNMPDRMHVKDRENTLLLMPCFSGKYFGTKLVSVFPGAAQKGLPAVNGIMTLSDNESGKPIALMDGAALTAERTGAVGGLGVACLTPSTLKTAGVFGAGVQGYSQARYLLLNRQIQTLMVKDLYLSSAQKMVSDLSKEFSGVEFKAVESAEELVRSSQLVIAATTTRTPLFEADPDLVKGKTFISIGSFQPDMKEFPDAVIETADQVYVDTPFAAKESGDICQPLEQGIIKPDAVKPFAPLVNTPATLEDERGRSLTLFFKSVGMALFDLSVASSVYETAMADNIGTMLEF